MGVSKSGCLPCVGTASSPRAALGQAAAPCGEQSKGCSAPIDSTQLSQVHPVPSNFHGLHSSSHPSRAPCTSLRSHCRPTAAGLPRFCPPGQHYNFNPKALALDISLTLTSLAGPLALRQPRGALQAVTPHLSCTQLMKEAGSAQRANQGISSCCGQFPPQPPSHLPSPLFPSLTLFPTGCRCNAFIVGPVQPIYGAELLPAGQRGEQTQATYLLSINSSSALASMCTSASLQRSCPPTPRERLGGGSPGGRRQPQLSLSPGEAAAHREPPGILPLLGGLRPRALPSFHFPALPPSGLRQSSTKTALRGMEAFYKVSPAPLPPAIQCHLWSPAQLVSLISSGCAGSRFPWTHALRSRVSACVGQSVTFLTEIQVAPLRNLRFDFPFKNKK